MKRLLGLTLTILLAFSLAFTLASCVEYEPDPCQHRDADDDGKCDKCDEDYTDGKDIEDEPDPCQHRDANDDGKCDKCGEEYSDNHEVHVDKDDNGYCDVIGCGASFTDGCDTHIDKNDDKKCDKCQLTFEDGCDATHRDADDDGKCDFGGEDFEDEIDVPTSNITDSPLDKVEFVKDFEIASDFKIGIILLHDEASTYDLSFIEAMNTIKEALGLRDDQVVFKRDVSESSECTEAAERLVDEGCNVIFANSYGHEMFMMMAAEMFPEVEFCHATGIMAHTSGLANFHNAYAHIYEGRYLSGVAAGMKLNEMISEGKITAAEAKIGFVGAYTYAEIISAYTAFYLGAKSVCPSVTMDVQFTGSWYDEALERDAAYALIDNGCVIISQYSDSPGAPYACEKRGVPNVSYNAKSTTDFPGTFMVSTSIDWAPYFYYIIKQFNTGNEIATDWCGGISSGAVVLSGINEDIAADGTFDKIKEIAAKLTSGEIAVFDVDTFTVNNETISSYFADVDHDWNYESDTETITDGVFEESKYRSAPYFDIRIDGIRLLNERY